ncbi:hypothetical protein [Yersinia frederiksenii]|uniref:hypothetical protein n=1 Tax=Yersinia frederiksenii TaxID=29484 RepID=UPI0021BD957B|nr:hypothetical protein [Yersinia frederiksenii]MDN0119000.1 hypothetical protein [Yersinia frederiksenii]
MIDASLCIDKQEYKVWNDDQIQAIANFDIDVCLNGIPHINASNGKGGGFAASAICRGDA